MGKTLLFFTLIIIPVTLSGQKIDNMASFRQITSDSYFRFNYENDYFNATDRDYTQGYSFELVTPWLAKNPANHLLVHLVDLDIAKIYDVAAFISYSLTSTDSIERCIKDIIQVIRLLLKYIL